MKPKVQSIGPEHYQQLVSYLTVPQLLKLQEKLLDEEDDFFQMWGQAGSAVWRQCWDIVERRILEIQ